MARPGISSLKAAPSGYAPSRTVMNFERRQRAAEEDKERASLLRKTTHTGKWGHKARDLADRIGDGTWKEPALTCASATYMRQHRSNIIGNLHQLIDDEGFSELGFVTLLRKNWSIYPGDLHKIKPTHLVAALRKDIERYGDWDGTGFLFGMMEAEYLPVQNCYQFHFHGIAAAGMIEAIENLRPGRSDRRRSYKPWAEEAGTAACKRPILIKRVKPNEIATPIAYCIKHFWKTKVGGKVHRLRGDEHTRSLLFLDQWRLEDQALLYGIKVSGGRFHLTDSDHHEVVD